MHKGTYLCLDVAHHGAEAVVQVQVITVPWGVLHLLMQGAMMSHTASKCHTLHILLLGVAMMTCCMTAYRGST